VLTAIGSRGRDVHRDVACESFETFVASNEISFRVHFQKNANASFAVNVGNNGAFSGNASCFFASRRETLLTEPIDSFFEVTRSSFECFFAVQHAGAGFGAKFRNH
jgi:hypothetical protein